MVSSVLAAVFVEIDRDGRAFGVLEGVVEHLCEAVVPDVGDVLRNGAKVRGDVSVPDAVLGRADPR